MWVLIVTLLTYSGTGPWSTISMQDFETNSSCEAAAAEIMQQLPIAKTTCIPK